jgi:hypothetical protein
MCAVSIEGLPEWFTALMYSPWFYGIAAGIFFVVLVCAVIGLLISRKQKASTACAAIPIRDAVRESCALLTALKKTTGRAPVVVLAGKTPRDLPIIIPVNIAIRLAETSKCLLIDLDTKRNAVASVFDMDGRDCSRLPLETPLEKVAIVPAHCQAALSTEKFKTILADARRSYDVVLLNAPYLDTFQRNGSLVRNADAAVVFTLAGQSADTVCRMLKKKGCPVLKVVSVISNNNDG